MENAKNSNSVCFLPQDLASWFSVLTFGSRSHLSEGLKTSFEERMEKTQKEKAFKKLQKELKEEKEAEFTRFAAYSW